MKTGMVSITFRKLSVPEVADLTAQAGLDGIEWGGDVHVPHGDIAAARKARHTTYDAGLTVAAYGSYYRVAVSEGEGLKFATVLDTALELGAPLIRVWAGNKGSAQTDPAGRKAVIADSMRIAEMAAKAGIALAYEFHVNTLTDTTESAAKLLNDVQHPAVSSYWQPPPGWAFDAAMSALETVLPRLSNIHVFQWKDRDRRPLADGATPWRWYLNIAGRGESAAMATTPNARERYALLEFVRDDSPEAFLEDAATLKELLSQAEVVE